MFGTGRRGVGTGRTGMGALVAGYAGYGAFWGVWVVVFADFLRAHDLTPGGLAMHFVALSVAAIVVMTFLAPRMEGRERRSTVALGLAVHAAGAVLLSVLPTSLLFAGFVVLGVGTGLTDVFVNAAGQEIEARTGRPVLQWVHAAYGAGGAAGALAAGVAVSLGTLYPPLLMAAGAVQLAAAEACRRASGLRVAGDVAGPGPRVSLAVFVGAPVLLLPGLVVLSAFFIEGSMDVWSVIFLRRVLGASVIAGAMGFAGFALATAVGRAFAARVLFGLGYRRTILVSALGSMAAGLVAVLTTSPRVASVAFLVLGFCLSAAAPAAFGLAGAAGGGRAIAAVTTLGYTGFVFGPPVLGWLADAISLRATMAAVVVATAGIAAGAVARGADRRPEPVD